MRTRTLRSLQWLVPLFSLTIADAARAEEVSPAEHDAAVTNFQAGRRFVEQNDCKSAMPRFIESLKHEQNVGARFNLAECSEKEQRSVDAWNQYKGAEQLAILKNDKERGDQAHTKAAALEPKVLKVRLVLPENVAFDVKIDGKLIERPDHSLLKTGYAVEPGAAHTIEVSASNRNPWTKAGIQGAAGAELPAMVVDLGPPLTPEGADIGSGQRTTGLIVGGAGVVGLVLGGVFGVIALGKNSTYKDAVNANCPSKTGCNDTVRSARTDISGPATIATIGFIAGAALAAGGAVLFFTAPKAAPATAARLHLAPAVGPGTAGAMLGGTF